MTGMQIHAVTCEHFGNISETGCLQMAAATWRQAKGQHLSTLAVAIFSTVKCHRDYSNTIPIAARTTSSVSWAYRWVMWMDECPRIACTIGKATPRCTSQLAHVRLRLWKRIFSGSFARRTYFLNALLLVESDRAAIQIRLTPSYYLDTPQNRLILLANGLLEWRAVSIAPPTSAPGAPPSRSG